MELLPLIKQSRKGCKFFLTRYLFGFMLAIKVINIIAED